MRAKPGSLELDTPHRVGTKYLYATEHERDAIEAADYFLECRQHLAPMDQIEVYRIFAGGWDHALLMVTAADGTGVTTARMGPWRSFGTDATTAPRAEGGSGGSGAPMAPGGNGHGRRHRHGRHASAEGRGATP